jgi:hypothetical protein
MAYYPKSNPSESWEKKKKIQEEWTPEKIFTHPIVLLGKKLIEEIEKVRQSADPSWVDQISRSSRSILLNWAEYTAKGYWSGPHTISYGESLETMMAVELGPEEFKRVARPLIAKIVTALRAETEKHIAKTTCNELEELDQQLRTKFGVNE